MQDEKLHSRAQRVYIYVTLFAWIGLSISLIFINKHLLGFFACRFPFLLAFLHMATGGAAASWILYRRNVSKPDGTACDIPDCNDHVEDPQSISDLVDLAKDAANDGFTLCHRDYNLIAAFLTGALVFANGGFMYLSVPVIQMLKAGSPAVTFLVGLGLGAEKFSCVQLLNVTIICAGVFWSAYSSIDLHAWGVVSQMAAIICDCLRCSLLQRTMARNGISMDPIAALSKFAPRAAVLLVLPVVFIEGRAIRDSFSCLASSGTLIAASCIVAFLLNLAVCALIGATSALTTSISGVLKDVACIILAVQLHHVRVTPLQLAGYTTSLSGLAWYHYRNIFTRQNRA
jgi:Triose-phosphate Transporter family